MDIICICVAIHWRRKGKDRDKDASWEEQAEEINRRFSVLFMVCHRQCAMNFRSSFAAVNAIHLVRPIEIRKHGHKEPRSLNGRKGRMRPIAPLDKYYICMNAVDVAMRCRTGQKSTDRNEAQSQFPLACDVCVRCSAVHTFDNDAPHFPQNLNVN